MDERVEQQASAHRICREEQVVAIGELARRRGHKEITKDGFDLGLGIRASNVSARDQHFTTGEPRAESPYPFGPTRGSEPCQCIAGGSRDQAWQVGDVS